MATNFEDILLEEEQRLLVALVEASRKQPRDRRQKFMAVQTFSGTVLAGLDYPGVYIGDIEALGISGLLNTSYSSEGTLNFDVSPLGYHYYEYLMKSRGTSVERIEEAIFHYLQATAFEKRHSEAYAKWRQAEELLGDVRWGGHNHASGVQRAVGERFNAIAPSVVMERRNGVGHDRAREPCGQPFKARRELVRRDEDGEGAEQEGERRDVARRRERSAVEPRREIPAGEIADPMLVDEVGRRLPVQRQEFCVRPQRRRLPAGDAALLE